MKLEGFCLDRDLERLADRGADISTAPGIVLLVAGALTIAGGGPLVPWSPMIDYELTVEGIGCIGCEQLIERTLEKRTIVESAAADVDDGTVAVSAAPDSAAELIGTVRSIGYTVRDCDPMSP